MKKSVVCLDLKFVTDNRRSFERGDSQGDHVVAGSMVLDRNFENSGIKI